MSKFLLITTSILGGILGAIITNHYMDGDDGYWAPMGADWSTPAGTPCYAWEGSYTNPMTGKREEGGTPTMYLICTLR